jgi:hypothetical protein
MDLDETVAVDCGLAFAPDGAHGWRAWEQDGLLAGRVDAETVAALRAGLDAPGIFPLLPALVRRLELQGPEGAYALERRGAGWVLMAGGAEREADPAAVRRHLRLLAELRALGQLDRRAAEPAPAQRAGQVRCLVPGVAGGEESLGLALLPEAGGRTPVHVASDRAGSAFPRGRAELEASAARALVPATAAFLR